MLGMTVFLCFLGIVFFGVCLVILLKADDYLTTPRSLTCPETRSGVRVRVDIPHRLRTLLRGQEELRLTACSRWPDGQPCGEECLLQIDLKPEILDRALRAWTEGRGCALCHRPLGEVDWRMGHFSALDEKGNWISTAAMPLKNLPMALDRYRPVCWACNLSQCLQREPFLLKGDRRRQHEPLWDGQ
jgi:hypothetical protein